MTSKLELLAAYREGMNVGLDKAQDKLAGKLVHVIDNPFGGPENMMFQAGITTAEALTCVLLAKA